MQDVIRGALAGLAGTVAMSAAMAGAKGARMMGGETPPRQVIRNIEESLGVREELSQPVFEASWVLGHVAYGAAAGVAYEAVRRVMRLREPVPAGPAYGVLLWAFGYAGWGPGQLDHEMALRGWFTAPADPGLVFDDDRATLWDTAMAHRTINL